MSMCAYMCACVCVCGVCVRERETKKIMGDNLLNEIIYL